MQANFLIHPKHKIFINQLATKHKLSKSQILRLILDAAEEKNFRIEEVFSIIGKEEK